MPLRSVSTHIAILLVLVSSALASHAEAAIVIFQFEGVVTIVPTELSSEFQVGEAIRGTYAFESTTPPSVNGDFSSAVVSFDGSVGDYKFSTAGLGDIALNGGYMVVGLTEANNIGSYSTLVHAIQLRGGSLPLGVLPLVPPDLNQFSERLFTLDYLDFDSGLLSRLTGQIDSIAIVPEPSPLAASLCLLGAAFFGRRARG